jgi:hypothetical protein
MMLQFTQNRLEAPNDQSGRECRRGKTPDVAPLHKIEQPGFAVVYCGSIVVEFGDAAVATAP